MRFNFYLSLITDICFTRFLILLEAYQPVSSYFLEYADQLRFGLSASLWFPLKQTYFEIMHSKKANCLSLGIFRFWCHVELNYFLSTKIHLQEKEYVAHDSSSVFRRAKELSAHNFLGFILVTSRERERQI